MMLRLRGFLTGTEAAHERMQPVIIEAGAPRRTMPAFPSTHRQRAAGADHCESAARSCGDQRRLELEVIGLVVELYDLADTSATRHQLIRNNP